MNKDNLILKGTLALVLTDALGNIVENRLLENMIVTTGFGHATSRLIGVAQAPVGYMALGTGNTAAANTQTALVTEVGRAVAAPTQVTTTLANDSVQWVATFAPGVGTGALTEAGLFNAVTVGTMLSRTVFGVVTKNAGDSLVITWKLSLS